MNENSLAQNQNSMTGQFWLTTIGHKMSKFPIEHQIFSDLFSQLIDSKCDFP
jgi:hypothetical protein